MSVKGKRTIKLEGLRCKNIEYKDLFVENPLDNDIEVGGFEKAEEFGEFGKPEMFKLWIDLGDIKVQSAAQLGYNLEVETVEGLQVLCVTDLGEVRMAGFKSEN